MKDSEEIGKIRQLVGSITREQLAHVETFTGRNVGIYIPATGHCGYSISENHIHPSYSFFYSLERNMRVVVEGRGFTAQAGRIHFIPPHVVHHEVAEETYTRFVAILVRPDFFEYHAGDYGIDLDLSIVQSFRSTEQVRSCVRDFVSEVSSESPGFGKLIGPLEIRLAHAILRSMTGRKYGCGRVSSRLDIERVIEHIQQNFDRNIGIEEMASIVALSPSHFSRLFKKETGFTPQDYLIDVRLTRTRGYLLKSDRSLTEIAHLCGFASSAHFSSSFRRKFGITPSCFRKSI